MRNFQDNLIQITDYQVMGKLPKLMVMDDGTPVTTKAQWEQRRKELYKTAVELQFGTMPPEPEFLEIEPLDEDENQIQSFRIITGPKKHPVSFIMRLTKPEGQGPYPAIVDGDMCWRYHFDKEFTEAIIGQGVLFVTFNRTELAPDRLRSGRNGPLYKAYPEYTFGAMGAWAWGYSRCVDALEKLGIADMDNIAFSGHSRGGKAALLAGVLDTRAAIVNPNGSGAGGCGCYRVKIEALTEFGEPRRSETIKDLTTRELTSFWFGPELVNYVDKEAELPFDQHFLKAMVAPRMLVETDAASDIWANPVGSWQTAMAAKEAYRFLGAEENLLLYFRKGYHLHHVEDIRLLASSLSRKKNGLPPEDGAFRIPFQAKEPIY